jgi:hypothetical protein
LLPSQPPVTPAPPPPSGPVINRLMTYENDRCGVSVAIRSRIVG